MQPTENRQGSPSPAERRPRNIAILSSARDGGERRVNVDIANLLCREGWPVTLVMATSTGPFIADLDPSVRVVDLRTRSHLGFFLRLTRYLRRNRHDCLLVSQHHIGAMAILARALSQPAVRLIIVIHTHVSALLAQSPLRPIYALVLRVLFPLADDVVCVSRGLAHDMRAYLRAPARVIYNSVSIPRLYALADERCDEPWLSHEKNAPVVLGVGRLVPQKDFACLLRAMAILLRAQPAKLILIGDGPLREELASLATRLGIESHVRFVGSLRNPYPWMKRADVLAASSRFEGLPLVLLEALALGVPVVSTDCDSGPAEILDNGRFGRLVSVGDENLLAAGLAEALNDGSSRALGIGRAADFSEHDQLRGYLAVLEATS